MRGKRGANSQIPLQELVQNFQIVAQERAHTATVGFWMLAATSWWLCIPRALIMTPRKMASVLKMPWQNLVLFCCATFYHSEFHQFLTPPPPGGVPQGANGHEEKQRPVMTGFGLGLGVQEMRPRMRKALNPQPTPRQKEEVDKDTRQKKEKQKANRNSASSACPGIVSVCRLRHDPDSLVTAPPPVSSEQ